jgi:hypothetical protein
MTMPLQPPPPHTASHPSASASASASVSASFFFISIRFPLCFTRWKGLPAQSMPSRKSMEEEQGKK